MDEEIFPGVIHDEDSESDMWVALITGRFGSLFLMTFVLWVVFSIAQVIPDYYTNANLLSISLIYLSTSYLFTLIFIYTICSLRGAYRVGLGFWKLITPSRNHPEIHGAKRDRFIDLLFGIEDISEEIEFYKEGTTSDAVFWACLSLTLSVLASLIGTFIILTETEILGSLKNFAPVQITPDWVSNLGLPGFLLSVVLETEFVSQYPRIVAYLLVIPGILVVPMLINSVYLLERLHHCALAKLTHLIDSTNSNILSGILILVIYIILYFVTRFTIWFL